MPTPRRRRTSSLAAQGRVRTVAAALLSIAAVLATVLAGSTTPPAAAQTPATGSLSIQKVAGATTVSPGETFVYTIQVQCTTAAADGCVNATLTDPLPAYVTLDGPVTITGASAQPAIDEGPPLVIEFRDDLGGGEIGLAPGQIVTITVPVLVDPALPPDQDGVAIDNTAMIDADNADAKDSTATVTPEVEQTIAVSTGKSFDPPSQVSGTTEPVAMSLIGTNDSNVPVDTIVIQDPTTDPPPPDGAFTALNFTGTVDVTMPDGADTVQVEVYDSSTGTWVAGPVGPPADLPGSVDPTDIIGIRVTFADTDGDGIQQGATAGVEVELQQADPLPIIPEGVVPNDVQTTVDLGGDTAIAEADADFRLRTSEIAIEAGKTIEPSPINTGNSSTVTLTGTNATPADSPEPMTSMTIVEPAPRSPFNMFTQPLSAPMTFDGFTDGVVWPAGADEATITYSCDGVDAAPATTTIVDTLPDPPDGCNVTGFVVTFDDTDGGGLAPGATATLPFVVSAPEDQPADVLERPNLVLVEGSGATGADADRARDTLITIIDRLDVVTGKTITPTEIPGRPGQIVIVQLEGELQPFPQSTVDADTIVVQEPSQLPDSNGWFAAFAPESITATPVPACSSLSVLYTTDPDGLETSWQPVPGLTDIAGPTIVNADLPADVTDNATGIRFVYQAEPDGGGCEGGFPPGTTVAPNLSFSVQPGGPASDPDTPITIDDCAATGAAPPIGSTADPVTSPEVCDDVIVDPFDLGTLDPIDKNWRRAGLTARTQDRSGAWLTWSTAGYSGLERVVISDIVDVESTALGDSVFDAFDLIRIDPIPAADVADPYMVYDQILSVELFQLPTGSTDPNAGQWVPAPNSPCLGTSADATPPDPCDGAFPGYTVPANQRAVTIGFRLTYVESPTRADRLDVGAPPVGTGVAPSGGPGIGNDRQIEPVFELRDVKRSDPDVPVIADVGYNTGTPGLVRNTAEIEGYLPGETDPAGQWQDGDTIQILDAPVTVDATKSFAGGPLGIPEAGVPQDDYPITRVTLTGVNTTPAKIDQLTLADDTAGDMFEWFDLVGFATITPPADIGADDVTITLDGTPPPGFDGSRDAALALTEADLVDVTGFTVSYTGRINIGDPDPAAATATVEFDARLRTAGRASGTPPTQGQTVLNEVTVHGADLVDIPDGNIPNPDNWIADTTADDLMPLVQQGIDVAATKTIVPAQLVEPSTGPADVTILGQPVAPDGGPIPPSRAVEMVLVDDDPRLWNQYDFAGFSDLVFTSPIDQVRVDALTGGTWSIDGGTGAPVVTGATWQIGQASTATTLTLPTGVLPADVQGLRFTFTRVDGANWENPANPVQEVTFQIQRRDEMQTGGPVPLDLDPPAPGETVGGRATNEMSAAVTSSDVDMDGDPLTDVAFAEDTIDYVHATNSVAVEKTPTGNTFNPGTPFTYTLEIENDGAVDILDPVVTDVLPVDAEGPILVLAPEPNLTLSVTPDTGTITTDPAEVTVSDESTDPTAPSITFEFPAGSTLPVGATYTISFDMQTRPGLPAGTVFTNEFGVTGDRPWDECNSAPVDQSPDYDPQTGACSADAANDVTSAGAIAVTKHVQAEGSEVLGVTVDPDVPGADPAACAPDGDGFHARPCVPIAEPGGDITWRLEFVNTGNLVIDRILGIDTLPTEGDTLATVPALPRGSEWTPVLTGERPTLVQAGFGTLGVWYTTGASTCDATSPTVADDTANPPNLLCPALPWTVWPNGQTLQDLGIEPAAVTGIQVEILPVDPFFLPAATVDVDVPMVAPAFAPDSDVTAPQEQPDLQSYNTVGTSGRVLVQGNPSSYTLPSEPPRVGVALANGPIQVEKIVTGDADRYAPDEFLMTLACTSAGEDVPIPIGVADMVLEPGVPQTVNNLPWNAECTVTERGTHGATDVTVVTANVTREGEEIETVTITNRYDDAPLSITKAVDSDAVDQDGRPISYGPFAVQVRCTFQGAPAYADGYGPLRPMNFTLTDGQTIDLTGLPVGSSCTITETDDKGASVTTITMVIPAGVATLQGMSADIDLNDTTAVTLTNAFDDGSVRIVKAVRGSTAAPGAAGPFTVRMTCTLDDASGIRTVYDDNVVLGGGSPLARTIGNLPTGAVCQFRETNAQGASSVVITPSGAITVSDGTVATLTVTNTFDPPPQPPLPETGGSVERLVGAGLALLVAGGVVLLVSRRRRHAMVE